MVVDRQKGSHGDEAGILGEGEREKERKKKERNRGSGAAVDINSKFGPFFSFFIFFLFFLLRGEINFFFQSS